jgi:hypothetical protein
MCQKLQYQISRYEGDRLSGEEINWQAVLRSEYPTYDILKEYQGSHPSVMQRRIEGATRIRPRKNRWLNPQFYSAILQHGFHG